MYKIDKAKQKYNHSTAPSFSSKNTVSGVCLWSNHYCWATMESKNKGDQAGNDV